MTINLAGWLLFGVLIACLVMLLIACMRFSTRRAEAPRDAHVRAGAYPIPYVIRLRGWKGAAGVVLACDVALAVTARLLEITPLIVAVFSFAAFLLLWAYSRLLITLDVDVLRFRSLIRERVIPYEEITSVAPGWTFVATSRGAAVNVVLRLGTTGNQRAVDLPLTLVGGKDRAIIVDRLQSRAPQANFSADMHSLWTGTF